MSSENAAGITEIRCHHQVLTREGNATGPMPLAAARREPHRKSDLNCARPRCPDIPHIHASFLQRNSVPSATSDGNAPSERENSVISGHQQLANGQKTVLSANRKGSIKQTNTSQILVSETVPDRRVQPSR